MPAAGALFEPLQEILAQRRCQAVDAGEQLVGGNEDVLGGGAQVFGVDQVVVDVGDKGFRFLLQRAVGGGERRRDIRPGAGEQGQQIINFLGVLQHLLAGGGDGGVVGRRPARCRGGGGGQATQPGTVLGQCRQTEDLQVHQHVGVGVGIEDQAAVHGNEMLQSHQLLNQQGVLAETVLGRHRVEAVEQRLPLLAEHLEAR